MTAATPAPGEPAPDEPAVDEPAVVEIAAGGPAAEPIAADELVGPPPAPVQVLLRRAPRYRAFVFTGVILGLAAAAFFAFVLPPETTTVLLNQGRSQDLSQGTENYAMLLLALGFTIVGGLVGALAALGVERLGRR